MALQPILPPVRLRVLKKLGECIAEINPEDGYFYDLRPTAEVPERVFRGRVIFGDTDPLPMVSILEAPLPPDQIPSPPDATERTGDWDLMFQGFVEDDHLHPTDPAQYLLADVTRRLAVEKRRNRDFAILGMGKTVIDIQIGVGVVRPPDELSAKAYFWLPVTLKMSEDLLDPYGEA